MVKLENVYLKTKGVQGAMLAFDGLAQLPTVARLVAEALQTHLTEKGIEAKVLSSPAPNADPSHVIEIQGCRDPPYEVIRASRHGTHFVLTDCYEPQDPRLLIPDDDKVSLMLRYAGRDV